MKRKLKFVFSIAIIVVVSFTILVGCGKQEDFNNVDKFKVHEVSVGVKKPNLTPKTPINKDLSPIEMLSAGIDNYYAAGFTTKISDENVNTKLGGITTNQYISSVIYRLGVADQNATYLVDNRTGSTFVKMWEESIFRGTNQIDFRVALKDNVKYSKNKNEFSVKKWDSKETYNSLETYVEQKAADPTKIWDCDTSAENVIDQSNVWYDVATGTYRFAILFDPQKGIGNFGNVIKYKIESSGNSLSDYNFETLKFEVVMWPNGFIRSVNIIQVYKMTMEVSMGIKFTGNTRNVAEGLHQFTYNEKEVTERIDQLKKFENDTKAA